MPDLDPDNCGALDTLLESLLMNSIVYKQPTICPRDSRTMPSKICIRNREQGGINLHCFEVPVYKASNKGRLNAWPFPPSFDIVGNRRSWNACYSN